MIDHEITKTREELTAEVERLKAQRDDLKEITLHILEKLQWTLGEVGMSEAEAARVPAIKKARAIIAKIEASK